MVKHCCLFSGVFFSLLWNRTLSNWAILNGIFKSVGCSVFYRVLFGYINISNLKYLKVPGIRKAQTV